MLGFVTVLNHRLPKPGIIFCVFRAFLSSDKRWMSDYWAFSFWEKRRLGDSDKHRYPSAPRWIISPSNCIRSATRKNIFARENLILFSNHPPSEANGNCMESLTPWKLGVSLTDVCILNKTHEENGHLQNGPKPWTIVHAFGSILCHFDQFEKSVVCMDSKSFWKAF